MKFIQSITYIYTQFPGLYVPGFLLVQSSLISVPQFEIFPYIMSNLYGHDLIMTVLTFLCLAFSYI
jgi:uncharacterized membrane protein